MGRGCKLDWSWARISDLPAWGLFARCSTTKYQVLSILIMYFEVILLGSDRDDDDVQMDL